MKIQLDNGYSIGEDGIIVDMWHVPVCREVFERLGYDWELVQEDARTEYLESLIVEYREKQDNRTPEENKQAILKLRDTFSKSELLDLYQNGKYLP